MNHSILGTSAYLQNRSIILTDILRSEISRTYFVDLDESLALSKEPSDVRIGDDTAEDEFSKFWMWRPQSVIVFFFRRCLGMFAALSPVANVLKYREDRGLRSSVPVKKLRPFGNVCS